MPAGGDQERLQDLTAAPRMARFAVEYARNGGNGTQAAIAAGYSEKSAASLASRMLKDERVLAAIERHLDAHLAVAGESEDTILQREINWATVDIADYYVEGDPNKGLKALTELTLAQRSCVKGIKWDRNGNPILELHDATAANRRLAEYKGMLKREEDPLSLDEQANALAIALAAMRKTLSADSGFEAADD